jgi:hypothetical protein
MTFHYFSFNKDKETDCLVELDNAFYCQRIIYLSEIIISTYYVDFSNHPFPFPEDCFKYKISTMEKISQAQFEKLWHQKDKDFVGVNTVYKSLRYRRDK